ncbi:MAG: ATP-dependent carboxylate-amine ligase [Roseibium sp.]|uniref:ATP-grasp domain-containing protein n=1 Tax=Roseibium sp. TaxID=1936156 RepID=UPI002615E370|nr:ATP-dependent carboxylate-amine ligase [Roseibium sp.]MCV0428185.1 ATP-dependent carboxylate-amine ligase [Roseibium sp.]
MTFPTTRSLVFQLLEEFCAHQDLRLTAGDPYGHAGLVESSGGSRWFFKGTRFDLNSLGAAEIANDKAYASKFLGKNGLPVATSCFITSTDILNGQPLPEYVRSFTSRTNFPLYVKPNIGQEGRDVIRVDTDSTLQATLEILAKRHDHLLVQEEIRGRELRIVILDGEIQCAIERLAPTITGDGLRSIADLLKMTGKLTPDDKRITTELAAQNLTLDYVPFSGQRITVLPIANLSAGGTARIVTREIAPDILSFASRASQSLGLRYAGVDLILPEAAEAESPAVVLEVNAAPGLSNLARQGLAELDLVKEIYSKIFSAMFLD